MKPNKNISLRNKDGERSKDCIGYEGLYKVSNMGRVKSLYRVIIKNDGVKQTIQPRILKQELKNKSKGKKSYARVCLCKEGTENNIAVHKLLQQAGIKLKKDL